MCKYFTLPWDVFNDWSVASSAYSLVSDFNGLVLWQINPEKAREEFHTATQKNGSSGVKDLMGSMGLGMLGDQVINSTAKYCLSI